MQYLDAVSKMTEWSLFLSKASHSLSQYNLSMPQPVVLKKLKFNVSMKTTRPSRTNSPKRCPFHYRGLECKSRKSRDTWGNRQIWCWSTEWSRAKANRVLPRECTGHSKHLLSTTQKTLHMDITRWSIPKSDWLYSLQPKIEKCYSYQQKDPEPTVAQIMNSLLPNSDWNSRKYWKPLDHSDMT